jgi:UDP-N-acetylmuramoyl-L-alanyl-D-glutamate--2,6-diaminopimelate ligase
MKWIKSLLPRQIKNLYHLFQSQLASLKNGNPSKDFKVIGVTGTSGKTTTSSLIYHLLNAAGFRVGLISTVEARIGDKTLDTGLHVTSPDPVDLQDIFAFMRDNKAQYVVLECSSHALAQGRLGFTNFHSAVITNIKRDHLDWHKTWKHYANSKAKIIKNSVDDASIIFSKDDPEVYEFLMKKVKKESKENINFTFNEAKNIEETMDGLSFEYKDINFSIPIFGQYNINNIIAAAKVAETLDIPLKEIQTALKSYIAPKGRMEVIQKKPFYVIIDFAHNEDSFKKSLQSARKLTSKNGRLITVFGSAGLRDKEKRTTMGETSGQLADITIATSEDPRIESLAGINEKIIKGAESKGAKFIKRFNNHEEFIKYMKTNPKSEKNTVFAFDQETVDSRYDAVDFAIQIAQKGDVVITQGKGHEQSLCFGTKEYPFNDHDAVKKALKKLAEDSYEN